MSFFELFNGTPVESLDEDHRIAFNKPNIKGSKNVTWVNFRAILSGFFMNLTGNQTVNGDKTFTGRIVGRIPLSDTELATKKYVDDNAGGEEIIEVATYVNLPVTGDASVLYVVLDENVLYRWSGTVYVSMSSPLSYASQAEMEVTPAVENTKVVTPLRAWQGIVYWCKNTLFSELTTTDKTLVGSINELAARKEVIYASQQEAVDAIETERTMNPLRVGQHWTYAISNYLIGALNTSTKTVIGAINEVFTELGLKATQNPGVCARCRIYPADIVVDPIAMTASVVTVKNGQAISASCPLRFFTDGDGITRKWEFYAPITASFTNTNGAWGFYVSETGQVVCDQTPWSDFATIASIVRFYLNDTKPDAEKIEPIAYECHTTDISASDHEWMHAQGTIYVRGFDHVSNQLTIDANGRPTTSPNTDGRNTVIALTTGVSSDDGLAHTVSNSTDGAQFSQDLGNTTAVSLNATNSALFRVRTNDVSGKLSFLSATRFPFPWNSVNNSPQFITTAGVRTDVADNRWFVVFVYDFPDYVNGRPVKIVTAPQDFTTYALAVAYQWESIQAAYATMRDKEIRPLYKDIYYCDKSGGGAYPAGCKYAAKCSTTDLRTLKPSVVSASGGATLASNVVVTPPTGYTSTDQQSFDAEVAINTLKGNTTVHTTPIDADSLGIWDSVASEFKRISLGTIKSFFATKITFDNTAWSQAATTFALSPIKRYDFGTTECITSVTWSLTAMADVTEDCEYWFKLKIGTGGTNHVFPGCTLSVNNDPVVVGATYEFHIKKNIVVISRKI